MTDGKRLTTPRKVLVGASGVLLLAAAGPLAAAQASPGGSAAASCSISGTYWNDGEGTGHGDGRFQSDEPGVEGASVRLLHADGSPVRGGRAHTTTDAEGRYRFAQLPCGGYRVEFTAGDNFQFTTAGAGPARTSSAAIPRSGDGTAGVTDVQTVGGGRPTSRGHVNAGVLQAESGTLQAIGDRVWNDRNGNGRQDAGEKGVPGVTVTLLKSDGGAPDGAGTVRTNADGRFLFTALDIGSYHLRFSGLPKGHRFTKPKAADNKADSDARPTGQDATSADTDDVELGSTPHPTVDRDVDAGLRKR